MKEIGHEETIRGRANYWFSKGGGAWLAIKGSVPASRISRGELLSLAQQVWGMSVSDAKRLKALESENARLKKLFAEAILENEAAREVLRKKW